MASTLDMRRCLHFLRHRVDFYCILVNEFWRLIAQSAIAVKQVLLVAHLGEITSLEIGFPFEPESCLLLITLLFVARHPPIIKCLNLIFN